MSRIVFLDDNKFELRDLLKEVELSGHSVCVTTKIQEFMDEISSGRPVDLFVLDVMLNEPEIEFGDSIFGTGDGMAAGVVLAKLLRDSGIETPIILLSTAWTNKTKAEIGKFELSYKNIAFVSKNDLELDMFAKYVDELFETGQISETQTWWKTVGESIQLKPSFMGIGIDLKVLNKLRSKG